MLWKDATHGPDVVWSRICLICLMLVLLVRVSALRQVPLSQREKLVACLIFACTAKPASTGMERSFSRNLDSVSCGKCRSRRHRLSHYDQYQDLS